MKLFTAKRIFLLWLLMGILCLSLAVISLVQYMWPSAMWFLMGVLWSVLGMLRDYQPRNTGAMHESVTPAPGDFAARIREADPSSVYAHDLERWNLRLDELWAKYPEQMQVLADEGCGFEMDDVTGAFHLYYDGRAVCIQVYAPGHNGWSVSSAGYTLMSHTHVINSASDLANAINLCKRACRAKNAAFFGRS